MTTASKPRAAVMSMYGGLALTVTAVLAAYLDRITGHVLTDHIARGYPSYSTARVHEAANLYLVLLTTVGVLGVAGWLLAIRATRSGASWARVVVPALFAAGTATALYLMLVRDTSGDTGLPPLLGGLGLLPSVAGLLAVVLVWRAPRR